IQSVTKGASPGGNDLVAPVVYDAFGREQFKYLPYVSQGNGSGTFKTDAFAEQVRFFQNGSLMPGTAGENVFYSRIDYEASPLSRILRSYAPGAAWAKNDPATTERGGNHPQETQYLINTQADSVQQWNLAADVIIPVSNGSYANGTLIKTVTIDEARNSVIEYKDKDGKVMLKKVQLSGNPGSAHVGWLCTYYVYDDLGNLRFVLSPKAVAAIMNNWVITPVVAKELCFIYRYDSRNRMIIKKVPGADSTEMVYDIRDRLVYSRDGNMKLKNNWLVTYYDALNRAVMTALYNSDIARHALQTATDQVTSDPATPAIIADLLVDSYDGRAQYQASNSIIFKPGFNSNGGSFIAEIVPEIPGGGPTNINNPIPDLPVHLLTPLTYSYYDHYDYAGNQSYETKD
ncbi:DUF6443 domain-containing protein, partial [Chitinophaga sp. 30R24]|uniref:DUF6443 domain-containing protein n=1 Tax=Chitinophaga sp. 30R24 TaxID=3248838 RepID=UPI003B90E2A0